MDIIIGEAYVNRTWSYLLPCVRAYGPVFKEKISSVFKLSIGIRDALYTKHADKKLLFILIDKAHNNTKFGQLMDYLSHQEFFIDDYCYDDILAGRKHMIVIEIPERYETAYVNFLKGKYSKMYTPQQIQLLYGGFDPSNKQSQIFIRAKHVLEKNKLAIPFFINTLKEEFGHDIDLTEEDVVDHEYDLPYKKYEEVFNFKEQLKKV